MLASGYQGPESDFAAAAAAAADESCWTVGWITPGSTLTVACAQYTYRTAQHVYRTGRIAHIQPIAKHE